MWNQSEKNMLIFGHRGAKALYPENTMVSFRGAIDLGVDGLETDVWMTRDGHLVLIHDATVDRTTDGTGAVAGYTLDELQRLDAGSHFSEQYAGAGIPTFAEFLALVKDRNLLLNIEIKDCRACVVDKAIALLRQYGLTQRSVITCFDADITAYAHQTYAVKTQGFPASYLRNFTEDTYSHYYSVGIEMRDLSRELCDFFRSRNIDPWRYCPDDDAGVYKMIESGATLATCNNPIPALRILKEKKLRR